MTQNDKSIVKLGLFVSTGLFVLISTLYLIGKSKNLFGSTLELRTRFKNANGLEIGNNIYFSGLQAGTIKDIRLLDASTVEVTMLIEKHMTAYIQKNATAAIGSEGLIGNKAIQITPGPEPNQAIENGDLLIAERALDRNEMLQTLSRTNTNVADISTELSVLVHHINTSKALRGILDDPAISSNIQLTLNNLVRASANANRATGLLSTLVAGIKDGKGAAGVLLTDTGFENDLRRTMSDIAMFSDKAARIADQVNTLTDTMLGNKLRLSLDHVQQGTEAFEQDMEALKHNFLLRGYFRRQEKKQRDSVK